jgi:hypothetical protein
MGATRYDRAAEKTKSKRIVFVVVIAFVSVFFIVILLATI